MQYFEVFFQILWRMTLSTMFRYMTMFYVGEFFNAPLGNVYAEDEDDWDVENKTFAFVDSEPERFFKYIFIVFMLPVMINFCSKFLLKLVVI